MTERTSNFLLYFMVKFNTLCIQGIFLSLTFSLLHFPLPSYTLTKLCFIVRRRPCLYERGLYLFVVQYTLLFTAKDVNYKRAGGKLTAPFEEVQRALARYQ